MDKVNVILLLSFLLFSCQFGFNVENNTEVRKPVLKVVKWPDNMLVGRSVRAEVVVVDTFDIDRVLDCCEVSYSWLVYDTHRSVTLSRSGASSTRTIVSQETGTDTVLVSANILDKDITLDTTLTVSVHDP